MIGTNFIRTLLDCGYRVVLERYLHEMSSQKGSQDALQTLVNGIADWEAKEPGVKRQMVIAFGLFSMPPGSINKQPNVDFHVWMDQQMNRVANHPVTAGLAGLEWWTSVLADEETVRFVGKLYRHYAIDGNTEMLTKPLFLTHIQNADFEKGTEGWTLHPAEADTIPVCITYFWKVFRAKTTTAMLTVSDWRSDTEPGAPFGREQTFNFLEIQPYRE